MVEPLAFGGLVAVVIFMGMQDINFTNILPTLAVMAVAGYRLMPALNILYAQMTSISTMKHTLNEVYVEFCEAAQDVEDEKRVGSVDYFARPVAMHWEKAIPKMEEYLVCLSRFRQSDYN